MSGIRACVSSRLTVDMVLVANTVREREDGAVWEQGQP